LRRDGDALDLRVQARPLPLDGNQYSLFAVVDISHEKRRRALERIFFHDILNTAGGMIGVADILRTGGMEEVSEFKDTIYLLATSLVDEIKSQQILSAAEAGELAVNPSRVNTLTLLLELRNLYNNHEVSVGRRLEFSADSESIVFVSDPVLVRRVVGNMIKNALEACRTGQSVTVTSSLHQRGVEFRIHNPGSIPREIQLQVFQRSFSTKGSGRGLGTYSMKLLTERYLQGEVGFVSTPDSGTTFFARFPPLLDTEPAAAHSTGDTLRHQPAPTPVTPQEERLVSLPL
jgi:signal transduction histidine kinase